MNVERFGEFPILGFWNSDQTPVIGFKKEEPDHIKT